MAQNIQEIVRSIVLNEATTKLKTVADVNKLYDKLFKAGDKVCKQEFKEFMTKNTKPNGHERAYEDFGTVMRLLSWDYTKIIDGVIDGNITPTAIIKDEAKLKRELSSRISSVGSTGLIGRTLLALL